MGSWRDDRLQLALRASKEGIWDWNLADGTIYFSRRIYRFLAYRKEEMPNFFAQRREYMDEESVLAVDEALQRVIQEGEELFAVEPMVRTSEGKEKFFRVRGTPVRDELGKVIRIAGSMIDISQRKLAELELAEERHLIQMLMDHMPMNVYFKDRDSRFVMANLATARKMGLSSARELVGKSDLDFFSADHARPAREAELRIMETGQPVVDQTEHEYWENRPDTWVKTTKYPWVGPDGKVRGTFGVTSDISELIRMRQEQERVAAELNAQNKLIEDERQWMRLIIDSVPLNVYFKDRDHRFLIANQSLADWVGFEKPEDFYDLSDRDLFSEEHWSKAERDEKRIMETGEPLVSVVEREVWSGKKDTFVMTSKYPWRDSEGKIVGTFGVSSDVSELMTAQQAVHRSAEELDAKNHEMISELALAREVQAALLQGELHDVCSGDYCLRFERLYESSEELTGDFYEVIELGEGKVGFLVGEVKGRGVTSALIVSMLRGLIEQQTKVAGDPGKFLTGLNDGLGHLLERSSLGIKATMFYGVVDLDGPEIRLAVAGHVNPIAVFGDGIRQLVPPEHASGPALGEELGRVYGSVKASVDGLQRMICFTEGVRGAENERGEEFGVTRMLEEIERGGALDRVLGRLSESVRGHVAGGGMLNSICLLGWEIAKK